MYLHMKFSSFHENSLFLSLVLLHYVDLLKLYCKAYLMETINSYPVRI
jgi:hypothetical protein